LKVTLNNGDRKTGKEGIDSFFVSKKMQSLGGKADKFIMIICDFNTGNYHFRYISLYLRSDAGTVLK
jgi:hypothetical protein